MYIFFIYMLKNKYASIYTRKYKLDPRCDIRKNGLLLQFSRKIAPPLKSKRFLHNIALLLRRVQSISSASSPFPVHFTRPRHFICTHAISDVTTLVGFLREKSTRYTYIFLSLRNASARAYIRFCKFMRYARPATTPWERSGIRNGWNPYIRISFICACQADDIGDIGRFTGDDWRTTRTSWIQPSH